MKKLVRENLNEGKITFDEKVDEIFNDEIFRLREKIFPKLNDDEVEYFTKKLRDWVLDVRMEKPPKKETEWKEAPPAPRGDMDPESWGDPPDWRPREMGG